MKYICLGYYDKGKFDNLPEGERNSMFDQCFDYDDHLRANGHWAGGEALQGAETALTVYWKNGKVATTDGPYAETKEQLGGILKPTFLRGAVVMNSTRHGRPPPPLRRAT